METVQSLEASQHLAAPDSNTEAGTRQSARMETETDWGSVVFCRDRLLRTRVWRVLKRLGLRGRPDLVEELLQEVYCHLFEDDAARLRRCRDGQEGSMDSYLGLIAERVVYDQVRLAGALKRRGVEIVRQPRRRLEEVPDPGSDPERRALCRDECRQFVGHCRTLRGVGPGLRNVWVIRLALRGYSSREIAHAAGGRMTPRGVDRLVHRIRRRLARDGVSLRHRQGDIMRPCSVCSPIPAVSSTERRAATRSGRNGCRASSTTCAAAAGPSRTCPARRRKPPE